MKKLPEFKELSRPKTTIHSFTVFPENLNYGGTLFGGKVLARWILRP
jgi:acyl-CoA hydrolase